MKTKTVSDKIIESLKMGVDSEDDSDDSHFNNSARIVDFDEYDHDERPKTTDFRKRNVKLLSEQSIRYRGKISSRKELEIEDKGSEKEELDDSNEKEDSSNVEDSIEEEEENESSDEDFSDNDESDGESSLEAEDDTNEDAIAESKRQEAEIQKGTCVQNQLRIWERLLEMRIRTQKLMNLSNQLPSPSDRTDLASDIANETKENTCILLKNLFELKFALTSQFSELRAHMKRPLQQSLALNDYASGEPPMKRIATQLEDQHNHMRSYRNAVLLKWDDRTKLLLPGAGSKKKINEEFDVVRKIENTLLNRDVLIAKSRVIQSEENPVLDDSTEEQNEENETKVSDPNVYDDSDFYHHQLRELIEYKASSSSNIAEMTKQVIELQKLRQRMKKKVDTRASKGRKIRYTVHNKLVNFMAPDDTTSINWPNESKDELYKSLFAT